MGCSIRYSLLLLLEKCELTVENNEVLGALLIAGVDLGFFLNKASKIVGHHGWPTKKNFPYRVAKNCLKLDLKGIKFLRIMQLSPEVLPSRKCFNE